MIEKIMSDLSAVEIIFAILIFAFLQWILLIDLMTCSWWWLLYLSTGISMHKGYAFVQFTNPFDARNACHGEDGRTVLSQVLGE